MIFNKSLTPLIKAIGARQSIVSAKVKTTGGQIIDAFHGEMHSLMDPNVQRRLLELTEALISGTANLAEADGNLYNKSQPKILRQLAADKLFGRLRQAGLEISIDEVVVCPYSSLVMLEAAIAAVARPGGVILCPEGFYKNNSLHIEKYGLQLRLFAADPEQDARINPQHLRKAIREYREELCGILLTMPGNPLVAEYSLEELKAIGRVLVEEGVKVMIDSTFDQIQSDYIPLAAVNVEIGGKTYRLHDQIVTVTGVSKGHHPLPPFKIGTAVTGDAKWRQSIKEQLTISFQRETTAVARVVIEETTEEYLEKNRRLMMERQQEAKEYYTRINQKFGSNVVSYLGESLYGPFMLLTIRQDILAKAGIEDGWQLADMLLAAVGLKTVAGPRMGLPIPAVRINIDAPRISWKKDPALLGALFDRIERFVHEILNHGLTYPKALARIGVDSTIGVAQFWEKTRSAPLGKVAVLAETYRGEKRVSITPQVAAMLVKEGLEVCVESDAGRAAGFTNEDYIRAGAMVVESKELLFQGAKIVTWVKPPADTESSLMRMPKGVTIVGFTNPFKTNLVHQLANKLGINVLSLEHLPHQQQLHPKMDALAAMSRFAGRIALKEAIQFREQLEAKQSHIVLVIGAGQSGMAAARTVWPIENRLIVASTSDRARGEIEHSLRGTYIKLPDERSAGDAKSALRQQQMMLKDAILRYQPNIVITTARRRGLRAPKLLSKETLDLLPRNSVVIDLTASLGGNTEISAFDKNVCTDNGVWVCNKSNYPSAEARETSSAYAHCLAEIIKSILPRQMKRAL